MLVQFRKGINELNMTTDRPVAGTRYALSLDLTSMVILSRKIDRRAPVATLVIRRGAELQRLRSLQHLPHRASFMSIVRPSSIRGGSTPLAAT